MRFSALLIAFAGAAACAPGTPSPAPSPDRVLVVGEDGSVVRQSTAGENARFTFAAPPDKVWGAMMLAYNTLGIQPSISDRSKGQYGNASFVVPRRIAGRPIAEFFSCGSSITGPRIDTGRVYGDMMSVLVADGTNGSAVVTHVSGALRPNSGNASDLIPCASTGALETLLKKNIEEQLATH
jgi:hypothetical protein